MSELQLGQSRISPPIFRRTNNAPAMLIRGMDGRINLWSPAMTQRYGFTADQARGQVAHQLLKTIFWKPLYEVEVVLLDRKAWRGGLIHHSSDGRSLMTAHQWHLHVDVTGGEPMVTELHSEIVPAGETVADQLADALAIVAHELSQPMTAIAGYVSASHRMVQSASPDQRRLTEGLSAAVAQTDRLKQAMAQFRALTETLRAVPGTATAQATAQRFQTRQVIDDENR